MSALTKHEPAVERVGMFDRFDRMFDDWIKLLPLHRPLGRTWTDDVIRVDEFRQNGSLVIQAELPGIDPDKDVEITVDNGMMTIEAERHEDTEVEEQGYLRREMRYGSFSRTLPLPARVTEADIKASYHDGILEIRVPAPPAAPATTKVPITKA